MITSMSTALERTLQSLSEPYWQWVNIGLGNGFVTSSNKLSITPILNKINNVTWQYKDMGLNEIDLKLKSRFKFSMNLLGVMTHVAVGS